MERLALPPNDAAYGEVKIEKKQGKMEWNGTSRASTGMRLFVCKVKWCFHGHWNCGRFVRFIRLEEAHPEPTE